MMSSNPNNSLDGQPTNGSAPRNRPPNKKGLRPWLWIWLAFALQITAWVFWVKLASKHPVQEVPLVTAQPHSSTASDNALKPDARPTGALQIQPLNERGPMAHEPQAQENPTPGRAANERPAQ